MSSNDPAELKTKQVFSTGDAAEVCKLSQQTIIRCFDSGRLRGFRVPGSRFRRIPREELVRFMKENSIPAEALEGGVHKVLIVDDDEQILELFRDLFADDPRFTVETAATGYDAGVITEKFKPDLMILDFMLPDINGNVVCQTVRKNPDLKTMKIIIVSGVVNQNEVQDLLDVGADEFIKKPFDIKQLMGRVHELLEV